MRNSRHSFAVLTAAFLFFVLQFDRHFAFSSLPSGTDRDAVMEAEKKKGDESHDAMWLHQIQPSCRQELICLNPSHCSSATIWMPGREELASFSVISAAGGAAGSLHCPDIWGEELSEAGGRVEHEEGEK